jgi:hypothetical protein
MKTFLTSVGEGQEASCGPSLASQRLIKSKDVSVSSEDERGKRM